jgi:hypothetical protein
MSDNPDLNMKKLKNSVHIWVQALKYTWDLGARGLSDCVEGSWRD